MSIRQRTRRKSKVRSDVNLTPLIDVMMSLLAIFMITAPMLTTGIPLNLPKGDGKQIQGQDKTLDLSVNAQGQIFIASTSISLDKLLPKVQAVVAENPKIRIMISADEKAPYGKVIEVMALLRTAGYSQVGLKTDAQVVRLSSSSKKGK